MYLSALFFIFFWKNTEEIDCVLNADSFEYVEASNGCADHQSWNLRMPMQFFNLLLPLMDKEQLRGQFLSHSTT